LPNINALSVTKNTQKKCPEIRVCEGEQQRGRAHAHCTRKQERTRGIARHALSVIKNTLFNTLQHTATHCNTLQHTATHTNALSVNKNTQKNALKSYMHDHRG